MPRATDPVKLMLTSGEEREFLLTMGGIRRLKLKFGVKQLGDILSRDAEECGVPVLYEALMNKGDLTEDGFADLLPAHLEEIVLAVAALLGASFPERTENPPQPTP